MRSHKPNSNGKSEKGAALFMAIFALLLVSVVATGMMTMAGTETSLNANYKSAAQAFYDARAGVEEGRGRLWTGHPNALAGFVTAPGTTMGVGQVRYILNPAGGETVNPADMSAGNLYADRQYFTEWGMNPPSNPPTIGSISTQAGVAGPLYKWVRITPRTEVSAGIDVNGDGAMDNTNPLYYDGTQQMLSNQIAVNDTAYQVFEVTALAVTPAGSQRIVQYTVAPIILGLSFPSALTFDGPAPVYNAPNSNPSGMNGNDRSGSNQLAGCTVPVQPSKSAIGVVTSGDIATATTGIPANRTNNYVGTGGTPSIGNVSGSLPPSEQSVASLQTLVQNIANVANNTLSGPVNGLSAAQLGSAANPQITVVKGDLTLSGSGTGYGILVVTGTFRFTGDWGWRGVVLVIGQGNMQESGGGNNEFDGAVLVAQTLDGAGNPLATLGTPTLNWSGGGGNGIYYDSCWINNASAGVTYKVLSFREISQ
ncbi:MAG TPA: pilus assembly PilX N-terminal domain-containing protein [Candidatus Acidoferrum sp.]|nr:pilus assembly PilX N-terminal domain-containing protein [Candidatus Acidoferrum sp.]